MTKPKSTGLNFGRLLVEGVVVVTSILIAFALDAWWENRQLEQEMAEDLAIVEYELAENLRLVNLTMELMENVTAHSEMVIAAMRNAPPEAAEVDIAGTTLFWSIFNNPTLDLSFGGIDAWIAAGRMAGIESPELRQRLASVRGKVSDVTEEQYVARDITVRDIFPHLRNHTSDIEPIVTLFSSGFHGRQGTGIQDLPDIGKVSIPNSAPLEFDLQIRNLWYQAAINEVRDFQGELEAIQSLLREEMNR